MGIYDRDYYRGDEAPRGFHLGGQRTMVTTLVIINVAIFIIDLFTPVIRSQPFIERWLSDHMTLHGDLFNRPWNFWQLITSGFAHSPTNPFHVGLNMFMLWMFGRDVEAKYGRYEFLRLYLICLVFSGLAWVGIQYAQRGPSPEHGVLGASGAVTAVVILYCLNFPQRTLLLMGVFPIKAWVAGVLFVAFDAFGAIRADDNVSYVSHLAGAAFALVYFKLHWNFGRMLPRRLSSVTAALKPKPRLRVHNPDKGRDLDQQADRLLDKVHREGEDSLTSKERRILEEYSRRMRDKRG